jgi:hypothetical protein
MNWHHTAHKLTQFYNMKVENRYKSFCFVSTVYHLYTGNSYHGMGDNILHSQQVRNNRILRIKTVYFNNMAFIIGPGIVFRDI